MRPRSARHFSPLLGECSELVDPPLEETPLRLAACELERALVGGAGLVGSSEAPQQFGAGRVQILVVVERDRVDDRQRRRRPLDLGDRDSPVQLHHRRAGYAGELAVERRDLGPVDRIVGLQRGDRRLEHVGPRPCKAIAWSSRPRPSPICPGPISERS